MPRTCRQKRERRAARHSAEIWQRPRWQARSAARSGRAKAHFPGRSCLKYAATIRRRRCRACPAIWKRRPSVPRRSGRCPRTRLCAVSLRYAPACVCRPVFSDGFYKMHSYFTSQDCGGMSLSSSAESLCFISESVASSGRLPSAYIFSIGYHQTGPFP